MNIKTLMFRGGGGLLAAGLLLAGASPAALAATAASTDVTNTATVTFRTAAGGTTDQNGTGASVSFVVDRLVNLTVSNPADVTVVPGQTGTKVRTFTVTNTTNDTLDLVLAVLDQTGDTFDDAIADIVYEPSGGDGLGGAGDVNPTASSATEWVDNLTAGSSITVFVTTTVNISGTSNNQTDGIYLKAQASTSASTSLATAITNAITTEPVSDTAGTVDNVLNDGDGNGADAGDTARDGSMTGLGRYIVRTASITLAKSSSVVYDPVNCSVANGAQNLTVTCAGNPKRVPGARIVYKLAVINVDTAENIDATLVNIADTLDSDTTYVAGSLYRIASTEAGYAATTCYAGGGGLSDANDTPDVGGAGTANIRGTASGSNITFTEANGLTETNAVVYCYQVTIN